MATTTTTIKIRFGNNDLRRFALDPSVSNIAGLRDRITQLFGTSAFTLTTKDGSKIDSEESLSAALQQPNKHGVAVLVADPVVAVPAVPAVPAATATVTAVGDANRLSQLHELRESFKEVLEARRAECGALRKAAKTVSEDNAAGANASSVSVAELKAATVQARERLDQARGWMDDIKAKLHEEKARLAAEKTAERELKRQAREEQLQAKKAASSSSSTAAAAPMATAPAAATAVPVITTLNISALLKAANKLNLDVEEKGESGEEEEETGAELPAALTHGQVIILQSCGDGSSSSSSSKNICLRAGNSEEDGGLKVHGGRGPLAQYTVVRRKKNGNLIQLRSVAQPDKFLRITRNREVDANGRGGPFCWFRVHIQDAATGTFSLSSKRQAQPAFLAINPESSSNGGRVCCVLPTDTTVASTHFTAIPVVTAPAATVVAATAVADEKKANTATSPVTGFPIPATLAFGGHHQRRFMLNREWLNSSSTSPSTSTAAGGNNGGEVESAIAAAVDADDKAPEPSAPPMTVEAAASRAMLANLSLHQRYRHRHHDRVNEKLAQSSSSTAAPTTTSTTTTATSLVHGQTVAVEVKPGLFLAAGADGSLVLTKEQKDDGESRFVVHRRGEHVRFESVLYPTRFLRILRKGGMDVAGKGGPWCWLAVTDAASPSTDKSSNNNSSSSNNSNSNFVLLQQTGPVLKIQQQKKALFVAFDEAHTAMVSTESELAAAHVRILPVQA